MKNVFKRFIAIFLAVASLSIISVSVFAKDFSDVKSGKWYYAPVMFCQERGIVSGYTNGTFKPNNNITRAEFCVMLNKVADNLGLKKKAITDVAACKQYEKQYTDYKANKWYSIAVANCLANGYISGTSKTALSLGKNILRQDVAVMIDKMFGWTFEPNTHQGGLCHNEYSEANPGKRYWWDAMYRFIDLGIYQGEKNWETAIRKYGSVYKNDYPITRAEMCTVFKFILENRNWINAREYTYEKLDFIADYAKYYFVTKDEYDSYYSWRYSRERSKAELDAITRHVKIDSVTIDVLDFSSFPSRRSTSTNTGYATETSLYYY